MPKRAKWVSRTRCFQFATAVGTVYDDDDVASVLKEVLKIHLVDTLGYSNEAAPSFQPYFLEL